MPLFQMSTSKTLNARTALSSSFHSALRRSKRPFPSPNPCPLALASSPPLRSLGLGFHVPNPCSSPPKRLSSHSSAAAAEDPSDSSDDTVEELLTRRGDQIERLMKMERRSEPEDGDRLRCRWFPYCDLFRSGSAARRGRGVIAARDPYILEARKGKIQRAVENRSYSVCLVVEGLTDFGNVSAAFRSADALGIQSVHVISRDGRKRCNEL